eukprot:3099665-Karenia_brevis.AAC.1
MVRISHVQAVDQDDCAVLVCWNLFTKSPLDDLNCIHVVQINIARIFLYLVAFHEICQGLIGDVTKIFSLSPMFPVVLKTKTCDMYLWYSRCGWTLALRGRHSSKRHAWYNTWRFTSC